MSRHLSCFALVLALSPLPQLSADEKANQARRIVADFEAKLSPLTDKADLNGNKEKEGLIRAFFSGLKDRETKIAAIGLMDDRYERHVSKNLAAELLGKLIKDPDVRVRSRAAHAIGYNVLGHLFGDDLLKLVKEDDPAIKQNVIYGMRGGHEKFLPALKDLLFDKDQRVRMDAAFQLRVYPREKTAAALRKLLDDKDDIIRATGLQCLRLPDNELIKYLDDRSDRVRLVAIDSLTRHSDQATVKRVVELLKDPASEIRYHALRMLADLKAKNHVESVLPLLADMDVVVRRHAVIAMEHVGSLDLARKLQAMLKDEDSQVREHAARILGVFDAKDAAADIVELFSDENNYVRREAVTAVMKLDAKEHVDALAGALVDPDNQVRMAAAWAIGRSGVDRFIPRLTAIANDDPSSSVRDCARSAIEELKKKK